MADIWKRVPDSKVARVLTTEKHYPTADIDDEPTTWRASSGTDLYKMVNEEIFFDDTDYVESPQCDGLLTIELRQEHVIIAQHTVYRTVGTKTYEMVVTEAQRHFITDWSALAIWFTVNISDTVKFAWGPLQEPPAGTFTIRFRVNMGL